MTVKTPGFPISGELHRLSAASRAVMTAKVRSARNATIPPRSLGRREHAGQSFRVRANTRTSGGRLTNGITPDPNRRRPARGPSHPS